MSREYTYFWPTFNGALVAEMSPNSVFWYLFFKIFLGGIPSDPPSFCMLDVLCTPAPYQSQKGPLFLEKNLPTLSSAYGPARPLLFNRTGLSNLLNKIQFIFEGTSFQSRVEFQAGNAQLVHSTGANVSVKVLQDFKSYPQKSRPLESGHRRHGVWLAI